MGEIGESVVRGKKTGKGRDNGERDRERQERQERQGERERSPSLYQNYRDIELKHFVCKTSEKHVPWQSSFEIILKLKNLNVTNNFENKIIRTKLIEKNRK